MINCKDRTAIIIVNYKNYKDTCECIDSILASCVQNFDIYLVDNNSRNDSLKVFNKRYKDYINGEKQDYFAPLEKMFDYL